MVKQSFAVRYNLLFWILLILVISIYGCGQEKQKRLNLGDQAPDFTGTSLKGESISLSQYANSPVLVRFFSTDCNFCRIDTSVFNVLHNKYSGQGLKILYINTDENSENLSDFVAGTGITFPVLVDPKRTIAGEYNVVSVPLTFVMDPQHIVRGALLGGVAEEQLLEIMQNFLPKL